MENTIINSDCPDELRVRHASSFLQKRALTWWNGEKRIRGTEAALALTWAEFKRIMTAEFCPRSEIRKLETEFWELTQQSGENSAYTTRFQELSLLVPDMVNTTEKTIERYIGGLPMPIHDTVMGSQPATLEAAIRLATQLTEKHLKMGTLTKKGYKKPTEPSTETTTTNTNTETAESSKKRKAKNLAVTANQPKQNTATPQHQNIPFQQPATKKVYVGSHPQCQTCFYHHPVGAPCYRCTNCNRLGHTVNFCRAPTTAANQPIPPPNIQQAPRPINACYTCGDPGHFRNQCPRNVNNNARPT